MFMIQFLMSMTFKRQGANINDDDDDRSTSIITPYLNQDPLMISKGTITVSCVKRTLVPFLKNRIENVLFIIQVMAPGPFYDLQGNYNSRLL